MSKPCCENCIHWKPVKGHLRTEPIGECRSGPPTKDLGWNRTRSVDGCGSYRPAAEMACVAFAATAPATPAREQQSLSLDGTPDAELPPAAGRAGSEAGSSAGNRARRRGGQSGSGR